MVIPCMFFHIPHAEATVSSVIETTAVSSVITVPLKETQSIEDQTVSLTCETSLPGTKVVWLKDGVEVTRWPITIILSN